MHAGRSAEELLSVEQLCQRRLDNVRQLKELYETELLNALEELRSRHSHSCKQALATGKVSLLRAELSPSSFLGLDLLPYRRCDGKTREPFPSACASKGMQDGPSMTERIDGVRMRVCSRGGRQLRRLTARASQASEGFAG